MKTAHPVLITVKAFFTSESLGINIAPMVSLVTSQHEGGAKFIGEVAEKLADNNDICSMIDGLLGCKLPAAVRATDWRPMTREEVDEYINGDDAVDVEADDEEEQA